MKQERVHELFSKLAERMGEAPALDYGNRRMPYRELEERSNNLANFLIAFGASKGSIVAILAEDGVEVITAVIAVLKAGCVFVPLDPNLPERRLASMVAEVPPEWFLVESRFVGRIPLTSGANVICVDSGDVLDVSRGDLRSLREYAEYRNVERPDLPSHPDDMCYVYFTSGSTGRPKGIAGRLKAIDHFIKWEIEAFGIREGTRVSQLTSPSFDAYLRDVFVPLCAGGTVCGLNGIRTLLDVKSLIDWIDLQEINLIHCVPSLFRSMLGFGLKPNQFSGLKHVLLAGEPVLPSDVRKWTEVFEDRIQLVNLYGPSETTMTKLFYPIKPSDRDRRSIPIGKPMSGAKAMIVGPKGSIRPPGAVGEIYIRTPYRALGYYNRPELTSEAFIQSPYTGDPDDVIYKTGDLGRILEDGNFEFLGRKDQQVKIRGVRVELREIEDLLLEHEMVREVAVVDRDDGSGNKYLCAYVVCAGEADGSMLKHHLAGRLPDYLVPSMFVMMVSLPRTITGKIDRRALPSVEEARTAAGKKYLEPRTPVEEVLAAIWSRVLNLEKVGIEENFFEIGGHSLMATQVISRVKAAFEVELPLRALFEFPTLKGLAAQVESALRQGSKLIAPPLTRGDRNGKLPLSFAQQRLWFIDQLVPNNPLYNCPGAVELQGELDLEALERVINEIVRRHQVLRTRFEVEAGEQVQVIDEWEPRRLERIDLASLIREEREEEARRIAKEEEETEFELSRGPLLRVKVLKLEEERHVLLYTMHHIVSDGWSMEILIREVGALYKAYSTGEPSPLEELTIQYADFTVWQREWLKGEVLEVELDYWRKQLAGMEELELPMDHPRPALRRSRGASWRFVVEREVAEKLRELGRREGVTLFMTLLGGFDILMSCYSGQEDVALGTDIANRNRAEIEGLIGFFVNQLVLRVEVRVRESFRELLKRVREVCLGAYAHQDLPFEKLVEELQPERDLSRSPLFQAKLILQNAPREGLELGGTRLSGVGGGEIQTARADLTVAITDAGRHLVGVVGYSRDLFEEETIERLMSHYLNVLRGVVAEADKPICELRLLGEKEREQILVEWNETGKPFLQDRCIHELFQEQAERTPERMALMCDRQWLSYRELNRRANQLAHYLRGLGVGPEVVVGLCLERSVEMVVALLGTLKAGGAYLPIDPESPLERFAFMLEDAGVGVVLTEQKLEKRLPSFWGQTVLLDMEWERISQESESEPIGEVVSESLAYVIYTSGSTGRPKGVMINHGGLANYLKWATETYRIGEGEGAPVQSSIGFDLTVTSLYGPLINGKRVNLLPEEEGIEALVTTLSLERGYSLVKITPAHLEILEQQMEKRDLEGRVRALVIGGDKLRAEELKLWQEKAPGTRLINEYGPTESVVGCCVYEVSGSGLGRETVPIGKPIANTQIYVLSQELEPAPIGARGEIYISGAGLARGYVRRAELTGEKFIPNRFSKKGGERIYRTGDLGRYLSDGNIEFIGRADDQVKVRGYRIELGEIEAVLNEHRCVKQSVVVMREDERGGQRLIGYVAGEAGATAAELKRHVREKLPEYMVPEAYLRLERLPLTANGKVDRKALPQPEVAAREMEESYQEPRTELEEVMAGIWRQVLRVDRVGTKDNFFELGGHSLLAIRVVSRIREVFNVELPLRAIFEERGLAGLSRRVEAELRAGAGLAIPPFERVSREGRLPLSFAQQRLWFIDQLELGGAMYNVPGALRVTGELRRELLERVLSEVVRRHEVLRTRFAVSDGQPVQVIDEASPVAVPEIDLSGLDERQREEEARRIAGEEAARGFDLGRGPLLRTGIVRLARQDQVLLLTMHHVVSDEWSRGVLIREVNRLYEAYCRGDESPLAEPAIQYVDYAAWQRGWLQGEVLEQQIDYWREQLEGVEMLELPTDRPRPAARSYGGAGEELLISEEMAEKLGELGRREGVTMFMLLLSAFKILLYRYSGQEQIVVGTPIAGRNQLEVEELIGFFVNMLAIRTDLGGEPSVREAIRREREAALGAYAHQDVPFEKVVEELQPARDMSRHPIFQVIFNYGGAAEETVAAENLRLGGFGTGLTQAKYDLGLRVMEDRGRLRAAIVYCRALFDGARVRRMLWHLRVLLERMAQDVEQKIGEIEILSDQEREQILCEWGDTQVEYPEEKCVHELFEEQVERVPDAIAVVCEGQQITYRELNRRANQLAHCLRGQGVASESRVGIYAERSVEMIVGLLGTLKAGCAYVPLDPSYPSERVSYMLEDSEVGIILTQQHLLEKLSDHKVQRISLDDELSEWSKFKQSNPEVKQEADSLAYMIYTSGSTGRPKGVLIGHRQVVNYYYAIRERFDLASCTSFAMVQPLTVDSSVTVIYAALCGGGCLHLISPDLGLMGSELADYFRRYEIECLKIAPSHLAALLKQLEGRQELLPRRRLVIGGEASHWEFVEELVMCGSCEIYNHYGPTETTVGVLTYRVGRESNGRSQSATVPLGRPLGNSRMYVIDGQQQVQPIGMAGELYIGGTAVGRGYLKRAGLTAERFVPDPYSGELGGRLYRTGDVVRYLPEGGLEFIGRVDDQVKVLGYRIELGEVEAALRENQGVREAVVAVHEDARGEKRLAAYVVGVERGGLEVGELRRHLKERLPEYMMPSAYVMMEQLPLTPHGKVNRRALPRPEMAGRESDESYREPRTEVEEVIAGTWRQVLGVEQVGVEDNFFELGGHSLLATRVVSKIREMFKVELPLRAIFEEKSLANLSRRVEAELRAGAKLAIPPIERVSREGRLPLSFAQQRLWFIDQLEPGGAMYNVPRALRVKGEMRWELLQGVLCEVVRRHEVLRTRFEVSEDQPVQLIEEAKPAVISVIDLGGLEERQREKEARRIAGEEAARGFDLGRGPLLRAGIVRLARQDQALLLTMHHVVSDEWSMKLLTNEMTTLYDAYGRGEPSPLEELAIQYADYAVWQSEWLQGETLERQVGYWREQLEGVEALELPTDRPRPVIQSYEGASEGLPIPAETAQKLRELARHEGVTMFMLLISAFKILLHRYSGQERIVVGTPIAGRNRLELEPLIGFFVNMLAIRTNLGGRPSVREAIGREREAALGAYAHQDLPFEKVVEELQPERDLSRHPVFQVTFDYGRGAEERAAAENLRLSQFDAQLNQAKYDLELTVVEKETGLTASVDYCRVLFDAVRMRRMLGHLGTLLDRMAQDATQKIDEIDILSKGEREQILSEWNDTEVDSPGQQCVHELFQAQTERTPDALAVVCQDQALTYRELNLRSNRLARVLLDQGVGPEVPVALLAERGIDFLVAMLAIFKAGGIYLPLDPNHPAQRLSQVLARSRAALVIMASTFESLTGQAVTESNPDHQPAVRCLENLLNNPHEEENLDLQTRPNQLAYVIYTSGSTGVPKGAMIEHRGLLNHLRAKILELSMDQGDVVAQTASQCFDISVWQFLAALLVGGEVRILEDEVTHDPAAMLERIELGRVSILETVPSMMRMMINEIEHREERPALSTIRWLIPTGEALPPELCQEWFGFYREIPLLNAYGPTECSDDVTHCRIEEALSEKGVRTPIGHPIINTQIYVLNGELAPQPIGMVGELYIGGVGVGRGYLNEAEKTSECFVPAAFGKQAGARLYRSGDLACYLPDGKLAYLGRRDHQVKIRGYRIELEEIESVLNEMADVKQAAVVAGDDADGDKRLVAYVVMRNGEGSRVSELREYLKQRLPEYMAPGVYVRLERLPLTANGKLDKKALPRPGAAGPEQDENYREPQTEIEEVLAGIWRQTLRVEQVGVDDNFFELGGHSLLATRVASRLREVFKVELPLRAIFEEKTLAGLSRRVETELRAGAGLTRGPIERVSRQERLPLSFAQQRLWFIDQLEPGGAIYNVPEALRVRGELRQEPLENAFREIARRHEVLRTRFEVREDHPVQVIEEAKPVRVPVIDLSGLEDRQREKEARRIAGEEAARGFDLGRGPLLRAGIVRLGRQDQVLLLTMHHVVSDGWSMGLLTKEVNRLYTAYSRGESSPLEELAIQYADYAGWQRGWLQGEILEAQIGYWRDRLEGTEALDLPADRARPLIQSFEGAGEGVLIPEETAHKLRKLARQEGVTMFMLLISAFKILLHRYSGQERIVVGTPIAGRNHLELEPLIGFFVNMLAIRTDLAGEPSVREAIGREREAALGAYAHQDLPFEKVVEELQPERDLSRHPVFQVIFVYEREAEEKVAPENLRLSWFDTERAQAKYDLGLAVTEGARGLRASLEYCRALFNGVRARRMLWHLKTLLERMAQDADRKIGEIEILSDQESEQILCEWNDTQVEYPREKCIQELFQEQVERVPEAIAAVSGGEQLSYSELNCRANRLAHYLMGRGVAPEALVGICMERSLEMIVGLLGILKAGGAYLPLDPANPTERLRYLLGEGKPQVVLTEERLQGVLPKFDGETLLMNGDQSLMDQESEENPWQRVGSENLAYTIYTSGSTGQPKGVSVTQRNVVRLVKNNRYAILDEREILLQNAPLAFDASTFELWGALLNGGRLILMSTEEVDLRELGEALVREQITTLWLTASLFNTVVDVEGGVEKLRGVRQLLAGGEALSPSHVERASKRLPGTELINGYGPTEGTTFSSCHRIRGEDLVEGRSIPIGRAIANTELFVLDEKQRMAPVGVRGELYIGGAGVARGYLERPSLTAERFVPNPNSRVCGERVYRTGDIVRWGEEGSIEFLGRKDEQVKLRGYRVELGEIESRLVEHAGVAEAAVMAREEGGEKRLSAYVVMKDGHEERVSELREYLKQRLPKYMVPGEYVRLEQLPLTANGKLDKRALLELDHSAYRVKETVDEPRNEVEETLLQIWKQVLRVDQIGVEDNFFELGGHSLRVIQVITRIRDHFDIVLSPRAVFESPTIRELAIIVIQTQVMQADDEEIYKLLMELDNLPNLETQQML